MKKGVSTWGKLHLIIVLFLGFLLLAIGCFTWAMFNIWKQADYPFSSSLTVKPTMLTEDSIIHVDLGYRDAGLYTHKASSLRYTAQDSYMELDLSLSQLPSYIIL